MRFIKNKFENLIKNNFLMAIYAFLVAITAWFVISITIYPSTPKTINNIPLSLDISQSVAEEYGLSVINCDVKEVNIQLEGNRSEIGNLTSEDIIAKLEVQNVFRSGTKRLDIIIESKNGVNFKVNKITPSVANVMFDKMETREFELTPEIPNITFEEGKTPDEFSCSPSIIKITGPSAQLDQIAKCAAVTNRSDKLSSSYSFECDEIKFYNDKGAIIDNNMLEKSTEARNILINIPVLTQKTLDLSVSLSNVPSDFDTDSINFILSKDQITLASQTKSYSDFPEKFEIGKILLYELDLGFQRTFRIDTKDDINKSGFETVTVTLDDENLAKKEFVINDFSISNPPSMYNFDVVTKSMRVTMIGPKDIIESLTAKQIIADIDLLDFEDPAPSSSSFTYPVTIRCPEYDNVWSVGLNKVTISREDKSSSATSTDN